MKSKKQTEEAHPANPFKELEEKSPPEIRSKILLMDDEEDIRHCIGEALSYVGFDVGLAREGGEALEMYKKAMESNEPYEAVVLDLAVRGGKGGLETIKKLLDIDPRVKAIVSSGYSNDPVMSDYGQYGFSGAMPKPYEFSDLAEKLNEVISGTVE